MVKPLISVLIPCFNHEAYIESCLQSIADQDYAKIELIIIDDGSSDGSYKKIEKFAKAHPQRFHRLLHLNRPNQGLAKTLNELVELSEGDLISVIASDDEMTANRLTRQVKILDEIDGVIAVFGTVELIDCQGNTIKKTRAPKEQVTLQEIGRHRHYLPAPTMTVRGEAYRALFPLPSNIIIEDWYTLLRLATYKNLLQTGEVFARYRIHNSNTSGNPKKMREGRLEIIHLLSDRLDVAGEMGR